MQLTKCSGANDGFLGFGQPNKLLTEEKVVFDFIETLCAPTISYYEFLFNFLTFNPDDLRSEAFIRRALSIFFNAILKGKLCPPQEALNQNLIQKVIPQLLIQLTELVELRYDVEVSKILIFAAKGQPTLFYTAGLYMILITSFLINPEQFRARICAHQQATNESRLGTPKTTIESAVSLGETGGVQSVGD